jgi:thymidylate synthase (FAD)
VIEVEKSKVFLVQQPSILWGELRDYLKEVGGEAWINRVLGDEVRPSDSELLIEAMGRLCYCSWDVGLNKNVTRVREDSGDYLLNVLRQAHGSVLAHSHFSFMIHDVSRVLTAELNRHSAGTDISEQSLRYVRLDQLRFRVPPVLKPQTQKAMRRLIEHIEEEMSAMMITEGLDDQSLDFTRKKTVTSALRRAAPMGLLTEEGWTANVRAIRNVIEQRSAAGAEEEIRVFADQLAQIMQVKCPLLFGDYEPDQSVSPSAWSTPYRKV